MNTSKKSETRKRASSKIALFLAGLLLVLSSAGCAGTSQANASIPGQEQPAGVQTTAPAAPAGTGCDEADTQMAVCRPVTSPEEAAQTTPQGAGPPSTLPGPSLDPVETSQPEIPPTPCPQELCIYAGVFSLSRPVAPEGRDSIDTSYRFGSTQGGSHDPHHGVEFLNSHGTPVLAAADGLVVVAGDDRKTFYGPYSYFYGNLVVLKHELPGLAQAVYTLYGHLSEISVRLGQAVRVGQQVGRVGMSGVATGSHLHFEVRLGENLYSSSRNPELWLKPHLDQEGQPKGAIAGRILDTAGNHLPVPGIVIEHLPAADQPADSEFYLEPYVEKALVGQTPFEESFAAGDLPAGWYRISFVQRGMQQRVIQVFPGQLTVVTFQLDE